jgi:iron complex outermembrane receptor protein
MLSAAPGRAQDDPADQAADEPADVVVIEADDADDTAFGDEVGDLADLSLEQLMNVQVTSVAGTEQDLFTTPAAMSVITNEDIRRTGHQRLAEVFRLVPGMQAARVTSNSSAISTRGFNGLYANKQLVLIDGRIIYDPLFSGVFWDGQDVLLEDVDRIEIIRGPGATLWGANAVNGVINVTSRPARDTHGLYATGGFGNELQGFGAARYGGKIHDDTHYRVWGQYHNSDSTVGPDGNDRPDDWDMWRFGARLDHELDTQTTLTFDAGGYYTRRLGTEERRANPLVPFGSVVGDGDGQAHGGHLAFPAQAAARTRPGALAGRCMQDWNIHMRVISCLG